MIAQGSKTLGGRQTAFDAEVAAIEAAVEWHRRSEFKHLVLHSDSTSAIARACHGGAGPGQGSASNIHRMVGEMMAFEGRSAEIRLVQRTRRQPARADRLAGMAAERTLRLWSRVASLACVPQTSDPREVPRSQRALACEPRPPWHGRDPTAPSKEVMPRQSEKHAGPHGSTNPHRALEVSRLPQTDPQVARRVRSSAGAQVTRAPTLSEYQARGNRS